jgi:hypothetical protein
VYGERQGPHTIRAGVLRARARLRLLVGMRLLERLTSDSNPVGQRLPSIRDVAAATGMHRNTAAAAYSDLALLGLIRSDVGSGSFSSSPRQMVRDRPSGVIQCRELELARLLSFELGQTATVVRPGATVRSAAAVLLHPLDLAPTGEVRPYPLAPAGETLAAIRSLRIGSTAVIVSESRAARRLMRNAVRAIHGSKVGVVCLQPDTASPELIAHRTGDIPSIFFHDADWSPGTNRKTCSIRLLSPGWDSSVPTGTPVKCRLYG